jgi:hypothetical protein
MLDRTLFARELTPATAWLLGLIVGDGCICRRNGRVTGVQLSGDLDVCEKAIRILGCRATAKHLKGGCFGFECGSPSIARSLMDRGIMPAKTYTVPWLQGIPEDLESHFMRGFWDADGCVTSGTSYGKLRPILTAVSCSQDLMVDVHRRVRAVTGSKGQLYRIARPNRVPKFMSTVNCNNAIRLGTWLWAISTPETRSNRKHQSFQHWLEMWGSRTVVELEKGGP